MVVKSTFRSRHLVTAALFAAAWSSQAILLAQQPTPPSAQPNAPRNAASSSVEQGQTPLTETFDFRDFRLEARRRAFEDTKFDFNIRTYYLDRNNFDGTEDQAWTIGGWAGLKTGYFLNHIAFGITGYTSLPIHAPEDRDGTLLLEPGQDEFAVLGEAYAEIRIVDNLLVSVGRKAFDTPFINRNDTRMVPNTFEAIVLQGRVEFEAEPLPPPPDASKSGPAPAPQPAKKPAVLRYGIGYFDQIKERNSDKFISMAEDAGVDIDRGVFAAGLIYEHGPFSIGAIDYFCDDVINIAYGELKAELPLSATVRPRLALQFVDQRSVGDELLEDGGFSAQQVGLKLELPVSNALFTAAYTQAFGGTNLRSPWSGYPGYTSVQVQDFNREGEGRVPFARRL